MTTLDVTSKQADFAVPDLAQHFLTQTCLIYCPSRAQTKPSNETNITRSAEKLKNQQNFQELKINSFVSIAFYYIGNAGPSLARTKK